MSPVLPTKAVPQIVWKPLIFFESFACVAFTVYDGVYHTRGDSVWGSTSLIAQCVILRSVETPEFFVSCVCVAFAVYDGVYHTPGGNLWDSTTLITR